MPRWYTQQAVPPNRSPPISMKKTHRPYMDLANFKSKSNNVTWGSLDNSPQLCNVTDSAFTSISHSNPHPHPDSCCSHFYLRSYLDIALILLVVTISIPPFLFFSLPLHFQSHLMYLYHYLYLCHSLYLPERLPLYQSLANLGSRYQTIRWNAGGSSLLTQHQLPVTRSKRVEIETWRVE